MVLRLGRYVYPQYTAFESGNIPFDAKVEHLLFRVMYFVVCPVLPMISQKRNLCYFTAPFFKGISKPPFVVCALLRGGGYYHVVHRLFRIS
jgi:hypothetical protein